MKFRNLILIAVSLLVIGVLGGAYYLFTNLDSIVKSAIERYGSEALATKVTVGSVSISVSNGQGTITDLRVAEPRGFGDGDAISFGEISVGIDAQSLVNQKPIIIDLVRVMDPSVEYVIDAKGQNNLSVLQGNISRYAGSSTSKPTAEDNSGPPTLIRIKKLQIEGTEVAADLSALGLQPKQLKIPPINGSNLGGSAGAPPAKIATQLAENFVRDTLVAVGKSQIADQVGNLLKNSMGDEEAGQVKGLLDGFLNSK
ncbi:MAG: hypothetical protein P8M78_05895 [Myxococcota bacterium]|nr:hypothetical protein [Myxococcota bacterium]